MYTKIIWYLSSFLIYINIKWIIFHFFVNCKNIQLKFEITNYLKHIVHNNKKSLLISEENAFKKYERFFHTWRIRFWCTPATENFQIQHRHHLQSASERPALPTISHNLSFQRKKFWRKKKQHKIQLFIMSTKYLWAS